MKLHQIKQIAEDKLETKNVGDLWRENANSANEYVSTTEYEVRAIPDTKPVKYEAFSVINGQRTPYGVFTSAELSSTLKPIRPNQMADAEGFTIYTDPMTVEAFKYMDEPCIVELDDKITTQLSKGQYVIRAVDGNSFTYSIEDKITFEATLEKA